MGWADDPLLCLDFETTGTDPRMARPVSVAAVVVAPDGTTKGISTIIDSGVEIPDEAAQIHGITASRVAAEGRVAAFRGDATSSTSSARPSGAAGRS